MLLICGIGVPTGIGFMQTGYDPASQYLSELGATGAPYADIVNYAGFLPVGTFLLLCLVVLVRVLPRGAGTFFGLVAIAAVSVSYIGAVFYPCDPGCPAEGSASQVMHNALGILGYLGPIIGLWLLAGQFRNKRPNWLSALTVLTAGAMTLGFVLLASPELAAYRGASQRLADFSLFLWVAMLIFWQHAIRSHGKRQA